MTPIFALALMILYAAVATLMLALLTRITSDADQPRRGTQVRVAFGVLALFVFAPVIASAGDGTTSTPTDAKSMIEWAAAAGVAAGLSWIGKHVVALLRSSKQGRDTLETAHALGYDEKIAELAMHYANQEAKKAAGKLSNAEVMKHALAFAKDHGYDEDDLARMAKHIEARIAMARAQKTLADAVKPLDAWTAEMHAKVESLPKGTTAAGEVHS